MGAARLPAEQPPRSRRKPLVRARRVQIATARDVARDDALDDLAGDRIEDEGASHMLAAIRAVARARTLDEFARGIKLCRRVDAATAEVTCG